MFEENYSKSVRTTESPAWKDRSINEETMAPSKQLHIVGEAIPTFPIVGEAIPTFSIVGEAIPPAALHSGPLP